MNYLYNYIALLRAQVYPTTVSASRLEHVQHDVLNSKNMPNVYGTVKCVCCEHFGSEYDKLTSLQLRMTDNTTVNISVGENMSIESYLEVPKSTSGYVPSWFSLSTLSDLFWRSPKPSYITLSYKDLKDSVLAGIVATDYTSRISDNTCKGSSGEDLISIGPNVQEETYEITIYFRKGNVYYQTKLLYRNMYNHVESKVRAPKLFITRY